MKPRLPILIGVTLSAGLAFAALRSPNKSAENIAISSAELSSSSAQIAHQTSPPQAEAPSPEQTSPSPEAEARAQLSWPELPDLLQTDSELKVRGGGLSHCGPVAVSNSLIWLSQNGYPKLLPTAHAAFNTQPKGGQEPLLPAATKSPEELHQEQLELVRNISSETYMGTCQWSGTGPVGVLRGLDRYVRRAGYKYLRLEYQGWRGHQKKFSTGVRKPELTWVKQALDEGGVAFAHVGWYKPIPNSKGLKRGGGHWLTIIAAGQNERFEEDPLALVLHDPAPYAGEGAERVFVTARQITEGWLQENHSANSFPATGYYALEGGMHVKNAGDIAVLDGVVVLVLDPARRSPGELQIPVKSLGPALVE